MSAISEKKKAAQQVCNAFNEANQVGTKVRMYKALPRVLAQGEFETTTGAHLNDDGMPVIFLKGVMGYVPLDRIVPPQKPAAPAPAPTAE